MHIPQDVVRDPLYVIAVVFNPERFKRRWKLYRDFQRHVRQSGGTLVTIEAAFGERDHAVKLHAPADAPGVQFTAPVPLDQIPMPENRAAQDYLKVRSSSELWMKERLINRAIQHLPPDWKYVAWVDADVMFARPDWVSETLHRLQHAPFVQMWSDAVDLSPDYEIINRHHGYVWSVRQGIERPKDPFYYYFIKKAEGQVGNYFHPGFAWAARRDGLEDVGGLIDVAVCGAGDVHMATALFGEVELSISAGVHTNYRAVMLQWQAYAEERIRRNVDYVPGLLLHYWHGKKRDRGYKTRWRILVDHQFDPYTDLERDWQGLWRLTDKKPGLRDDLRAYFRSRDEDSIDL